MPELEPEEEFVSSLPVYDLPSKRDKTDLERYDTPEKAQQQKKKPAVDEPSPDWDRLKKKAKSEDDPNKVILGKGNIPDTDQGDGLNLRNKQMSPLKDEDDSFKFNPFEKLPDDDTKPANSLLDQEPTKQLKSPKGKSDHSGDRTSLLMKNREEDMKPVTKAGTIPEKINDKKAQPNQEPERTKLKPELKSIEQIEVEESPLERLQRLENAKPIEMVESESEEEFVSSLPIYDLPSKREKTDLEQYDTPENVWQQKS